MRILLGKETPEISIDCREKTEYSETQRLIGQEILHVTQPFSIVKDFEKISLTKQDSITIQVENASTKCSLALYKLQNNNLMDKSDLVESDNTLQLKISSLHNFIDKMSIWVHFETIEEQRTSIAIKIPSRKIEFPSINFRSCALAYHLLDLELHNGNWKFIKCFNESFSSKAGRLLAYGFLDNAKQDKKIH